MEVIVISSDPEITAARKFWRLSSDRSVVYDVQLAVKKKSKSSIRKAITGQRRCEAV